jgi:Esterase-like activity of phytase
MPRYRSCVRDCAFIGIWLLVCAVPVVQPVFAQNKVGAAYTFPDIPIKEFHNKLFPQSVANDRKVLLGSVGSDLWRGPKDPRDEFWMVTDRGPNGQIRVDGSNRRTFWVPEFNPAILRVKTQGDTIQILETIPIVGQSGKPVTGLPNLKGFDETPYNYTAKEPLPFNVNGLDTEGIVRTSAGDFWICEEYSPSLVHVDRAGKVLKRYVPEGLDLQGTDYPVVKPLPAIYGKRKINRGFEGIALGTDEKTLYILLQSPLANPDRKTGDLSRNTRVLVFDISSEKVTAEFAYRFDVSSEFDRGPKNTPDEMKLSAVVALNPTTLLVLERTDWVAKLYSVDVSQATNILNTKWNDPKTAPTFEGLADPATAEIRPLPKTLVLDLSSLKGMPEKIEGIAIIDRNTIAIANDNDFDSEEGKTDAEGNNVGKGKKSQIHIISLSKPLPLASESVSSR